MNTPLWACYAPPTVSELSTHRPARDAFACTLALANLQDTEPC